MPSTTFFVQICPTCHRKLNVPVQYAGRQVSCIHCQGQFGASDPRHEAVSPSDTQISSGDTKVVSVYGELIPCTGEAVIRLLKKHLVIGRRPSCDVCLPYSNVSGNHCELTAVEGYWHVKDLDSRNGTKVNNVRVQEKRLLPGETLEIAHHRFEIMYSPSDLGKALDGRW